MFKVLAYPVDYNGIILVRPIVIYKL